MIKGFTIRIYPSKEQYIFTKQIYKDLSFTMKRYLNSLERTDIIPEIYTYFCINGIFRVIIWWLREGKPIDKEELLKQLNIYSII